jgi:hypothetical protein
MGRKRQVAVETVQYTQGEFVTLIEARSVRQIWIETKGAEFEVWAELISGVRVQMVTAHRKSLRRFLNPAAALTTLRRMGVARAEVRMEKWDLDAASLSMRMRPDVTARRLREKRIREKVYFPDRAPEPAEADRKDQLQKLMISIMKVARQQAPVR